MAIAERAQLGLEPATTRPRMVAICVALATPLILAGAAHADPLATPPTFSADPATHVLDLLLVAKPKTLSLPFGITTTAWVYQVCPRPTAGSVNACAAGTSVQPFGGVRLALKRGDTLKFRLVNRLPPVIDAKHCKEPGHEDLGNNPTNIHTHGLLVEPHRAQGARDTYGDYVFLEIKNPANNNACTTTPAVSQSSVSSVPFGKICSARASSSLGVPGAIHPDMDVINNAAEYSIPIGDGHPPGLFWFHPHLHGISMNQITSGLAGFITVGASTDVCQDAACRAEVRAGSEQFLMLQDMQLEANGQLDDQQNAGFCNGRDDDGGPATGPRPAAAAAALPPSGSCIRGGKPGRWFHTVNGQVYPTIDVGAHGSIWRIVNASASRSYDLTLVKKSDGTRMTMQIIAVDGVPVESSSASDAASARRVFGSAADTVPCTSAMKAGDTGVCVRRFQMMPSSRIELRVINPSTKAAVEANFQTGHYATGPTGDDWPAISLADVTLAAAAPDSQQAVRVAGAKALMSSSGTLGRPATIVLPGTATMVAPAQARAALATQTQGPILQSTLRQAPLFAIDPAQQTGAQADPACKSLPKGHRRRIYFGYGTQPESFGLGYVELDENGNEVAGTAQPVTEYDPTTTSICLPLRAGNLPVSEVWELVNLTGEDHNFHAHQLKFRLISTDPTAGNSDEVYLVHDNIPVPRGGASCDGTLLTAQAGKCRTTKTVVQLTFAEIGDFVYHCHIMEHEDGGMMARIRVVPGG